MLKTPLINLLISGYSDVSENPDSDIIIFSAVRTCVLYITNT